MDRHFDFTTHPTDGKLRSPWQDGFFFKNSRMIMILDERDCQILVYFAYQVNATFLSH